MKSNHRSCTFSARNIPFHEVSCLHDQQSTRNQSFHDIDIVNFINGNRDIIMLLKMLEFFLWEQNYYFTHLANGCVLQLTLKVLVATIDAQ